jgi:hypothetical protein
MKKMVLNLLEGIKLPFVKNPESDCHPVLIVEQPNPPLQYIIDCADIIAVHKAVAYGTPATVGGTFSTAGMLPIPVDI